MALKIEEIRLKKQYGQEIQPNMNSREYICMLSSGIGDFLQYSIGASKGFEFVY